MFVYYIVVGDVRTLDRSGYVQRGVRVHQLEILNQMKTCLHVSVCVCQQLDAIHLSHMSRICLLLLS